MRRSALVARIRVPGRLCTRAAPAYRFIVRGLTPLSRAARESDAPCRIEERALRTRSPTDWLRRELAVNRASLERGACIGAVLLLFRVDGLGFCLITVAMRQVFFEIEKDTKSAFVSAKSGHGDFYFGMWSLESAG
jgi:hypothetical protein